jgi:two-component system phosphate regulon sensor histidine kinase PhoR
MAQLLAPFSPPFFIDPPQDWIAWFGWLVLFGLVTWGTVRWRETISHWRVREIIIVVSLLLVVFITTPFLGVRITLPGGLPVFERPEIPKGPALMFLAAIPWMLAGGLVGVLPATIIGAVSGFLLALLDTHSPFTIIEYAALALVFSIAVRQRYRTMVFRLFRHPVFTALVLIILDLPIKLICTSLAAPGPLVGRVDYAITHLPAAFVAVSVLLILGSLISEAVSQGWPRLWGRQDPLAPSPAETSLLGRIIYNVGPLAVLLVILLMIGDWIVAERTARNMLGDRLSSTAEVAAESIPYFLESGQNLVLQFASNRELTGESNEAIAQILEQDLRSVPYFRQLVLLGPDTQIRASYPATEMGLLNPTMEEREGFKLALKGVEIQSYSTPQVNGETTAQVSFMAAVINSSGKAVGVLWGRTDLASNPFTRPIIKVLTDMSKLGGEGQLVDENGLILYHPISARVMTPYLGITYPQPVFKDETAPDGTRQLMYFKPALGRPWAIILKVPAEQVQQLALNTALPLLIMILLIAIVASISLVFGLRFITASLVSLSAESSRISQGQLDHPLPVTVAIDEVGQLRRSFEQMRIGLKARIEELNRLLLVSQGVASSLEIQDTVQPILKAALNERACLARVVLLDDVSFENSVDFPGSFGIGQANEVYAIFDNQILGLVQEHGARYFNNVSRERSITLPVGKPHPVALAAVAIRHENRFLGALWVAYDNLHTFGEEEIRFLNTLAGQAGLATVNARLYASAEIGRQRLESILSATPDPVLVTDQQNRIILTNPAAIQVSGLTEVTLIGKKITDVIKQGELIKLLSTSVDEQPSQEIALSNGKVYFATVSSVIVDRQVFGKVCILRDITRYKELDTLKSEFVATVSHDLRSPLTLMRGYATMLQMVGELNEQQKGYVRKIISGVESMSRLVNNLLDLGRIEAGIGLKLEKVLCGEVAERVLSSLQLQAAQKSIQVVLENTSSAQTLVEADLALLQQALYNLVENAIKYTPVGRQVQMSVIDRPDSVLFSVRDNGIGIAPLDQPRLFEKFYRGGQRETYQQRGSGLGLAIVKSIVERHGGRVWLESQLGKGSIFYLEIPIRQGEKAKIGLGL